MPNQAGQVDAEPRRFHSLFRATYPHRTPQEISERILACKVSQIKLRKKSSYIKKHFTMVGLLLRLGPLWKMRGRGRGQANYLTIL